MTPAEKLFDKLTSKGKCEKKQKYWTNTRVYTFTIENNEIVVRFHIAEYGGEKKETARVTNDFESFEDYLILKKLIRC